ncbi:DUF1127 domain-containing protein [Ruegeria sp. 2012CJ41-6]|uniref:DUF1127 domain-containing protein n=1 Tax=Ruegeria spongiae TaxID=2942209 RepID=A0ABT0Q1T0_9RHOB|nr:DUF1127 domain-containing protein [Ruegeria spongiae]MCL6283776.1 DUF1127 domain-containing protein [Ruegeria spongiae]
MAQSVTHPNALVHAGKAIAEFFNGIFEALIRVGEANSRVRRIEALYAMSDAELKARGIRRENIIREVMNDFI